MKEHNRGEDSSDKVKNRRGLIYASVLVGIFLAALGITQCSDSSAYTFNGEYYNRIGLSIFFGLVVIAIAVWYFFIRRK